MPHPNTRHRVCFPSTKHEGYITLPRQTRNNKIVAIFILLVYAKKRYTPIFRTRELSTATITKRYVLEKPLYLTNQVFTILDLFVRKSTCHQKSINVRISIHDRCSHYLGPHVRRRDAPLHASRQMVHASTRPTDSDTILACRG